MLENALRFASLRRSHLRSALAAALALAGACDDSSPSTGTTTTGGLNGGTTGTTTQPGLDSGLTGLDSGLTGLDSGLSTGDSGLPQNDGSTLPDGATLAVRESVSVPTTTDASSGDPDLDALKGDYLIKFHTVNRGDNASLGEVTTDSTSYGVIRVVAEGGSLVGSEYMCFNNTTQTAANGTITTVVSDAVWPNLTPVRRSLSINLAGGTWSSPSATRRQGWRQTAAALPTNPATQPNDFLDPDDDGRPGVATRVMGEASIIITITADCEYDIVSSSTTSYAGTLSAQGLFASAQVTAEDAQVHALTATKRGGSAPCAKQDINDSPQPDIVTDEMTLVRVTDTWLPTPGACPSEAEFQAALP